MLYELAKEFAHRNTLTIYQDEAGLFEAGGKPRSVSYWGLPSVIEVFTIQEGYLWQEGVRFPEMHITWCSFDSLFSQQAKAYLQQQGVPDDLEEDVLSVCCTMRCLPDYLTLLTEYNRRTEVPPFLLERVEQQWLVAHKYWVADDNSSVVNFESGTIFPEELEDLIKVLFP